MPQTEQPLRLKLYFASHVERSYGMNPTDVGSYQHHTPSMILQARIPLELPKSVNLIYRVKTDEFMDCNVSYELQEMQQEEIIIATDIPNKSVLKLLAQTIMQQLPPETEKTIQYTHIDTYIERIHMETNNNMSGNNSNFTFINHSTVQESFNKIKNEGNEEVAKALLSIAEKINKSGNKEAAESFESFNEELSKSTPKKSSLKALWKGTLEALPELEDMVDVVAKIVTLFVIP